MPTLGFQVPVLYEHMRVNLSRNTIPNISLGNMAAVRSLQIPQAMCCRKLLVKETRIGCCAMLVCCTACWHEKSRALWSFEFWGPQVAPRLLKSCRATGLSARSRSCRLMQTQASRRLVQSMTSASLSARRLSRQVILVVLCFVA